MRIHYEPQLNHIPFDWQRDLRTVERDVLNREVAILSKLGFYKEYGERYEAGFSGHIASIELIDELVGKLAIAIAIIMDAGFKPAGAIVATLEELGATPSRLADATVEPEALGVLATCYSRSDEHLGAHWYDVTDPSLSMRPTWKKIAEAIHRAVGLLKEGAAKGRRKKVALDYLAAELGKIYLRFNDKLVVNSVHKSSEKVGDGGHFVEFLDEVLAPLNNFLEGLSAEYGERGPISGGSIGRRAIKQDPADRAYRFLGAFVSKCRFTGVAPARYRP